LNGGARWPIGRVSSATENTSAIRDFPNGSMTQTNSIGEPSLRPYSSEAKRLARAYEVRATQRLMDSRKQEFRELISTLARSLYTEFNQSERASTISRRGNDTPSKES
jgi:hypothetical protein